MVTLVILYSVMVTLFGFSVTLI